MRESQCLGAFFVFGFGKQTASPAGYSIEESSTAELFVCGGIHVVS
jgi:hypothetical protein